MSFVVLIQSFGLNISDALQIDEFINHMQFHSEQHGDSFVMFLSKHYGELKVNHEKEHQGEKEEHEQLPFKQLSQVSSISVFLIRMYDEKFKVPEFSVFKKHRFFYKASTSTLFLKEFFQPPKFL